MRKGKKSRNNEERKEGQGRNKEGATGKQSGQQILQQQWNASLQYYIDDHFNW